MAKLTTTTSAFVLVLFAFLGGQSVAGRYYEDKVEDKVRKEVKKAIGRDRGVGAALIRLVFHDCWVNVSTQLISLLHFIFFVFVFSKHNSNYCHYFMLETRTVHAWHHARGRNKNIRMDACMC
jgi:hypothetical protein